MSGWYRSLRPLVFAFPAETAHGMAIRALRWGLVGGPGPVRDARLRTTVAGLDFPNPVGMAAGFDKDAQVPDALLKLGFGFAEVGTVTPRPQPGNPKPRMFRLVEDEAVINRLGFNNKGHGAAQAALRARSHGAGIVGINIGTNKDSPDPVADYTAGVRAFYGLADYFTVNISSPNTPGLRSLQRKAALDRLLAAVMAARAEVQKSDKPMPLFVKVAPDLTEQEQEDIAQVALDRGVDGLIVSNTTLSRPLDLKSPAQIEQGGLSGRPLFSLSTMVLARFYELTQGRLPLIGVGGIASADDAYKKIRAGASLVQLYSAMVYQGPDLPARIAHGLSALLARDGFARVADAVGADVK
jgi:dihydroorotate dehydrogenase